LNEEIKQLAEYVQGVVPQKVYLRIGYEFDTTDNHYNPESYTNAFRKIVDTFRGMNIENVAFVWHSATSDKLAQGFPFTAWYPGDGYVDWYVL
jgi:beta-mannanase